MAELVVCSLEPDEHESTMAALRASWPGATRVVEVRRDTLRDFRFPECKKDEIVVLLLHLCEGRTTITDNDGLYNMFLVEAVKRSGGRVYVGLTGLAPARATIEDGSLADEAVVDELVAHGQASIQLIHTARRLLTWDNVPSPAQINHLLHFTSLPALDPPPGLTTTAVAPQRRFKLCTIL